MPHRDWKITCRTVTGLTSQIQQAIRKLEARSDDPGASDELLAAFKATCVWGGVQLPEPDSSTILAAQILRGRQALLQKQRP